MRRAIFPALAMLTLAAALAVAVSGRAVWQVARDNAAIRDLAAGHEAVLRDGADPRALHARVLFLTWRNRLDEAQAVLSRLPPDRPDLVAEAQLATGNARMRAGFAGIEAGDFERSESQIALAKAAYREALRARPRMHDAKVNLDLAMRLVRDLPRPLADGESDPEDPPRRLWTDLPGLPRGAP